MTNHIDRSTRTISIHSVGFLTLNENTMIDPILPILVFFFFLTVFVETTLGKQSKDSHAIKTQDLSSYTMKQKISESKKELEDMGKLGTRVKRRYMIFQFKTCM